VKEPIVSITREQVIASLESTGSSDPEVLAAAKEILADAVAPLRVMANAGILLGVGVAITRLGPIAGASLVGVGVWSWLRAARNRKNIEAGYAEFVHLRMRDGATRPGWEESGGGSDDTMRRR
jgi:hypothetical protein